MGNRRERSGILLAMIADAVISFTIAEDCWLPVRTDSNNDLCGLPVAQERVRILATEE
jgi:hypothetical protein